MGAIEKQQVYQDFCRVQAQQREPWYKTDELSSHSQNTVNFPGGESGIHGTFVLTNRTRARYRTLKQIHPIRAQKPGKPTWPTTPAT